MPAPSVDMRLYWLYLSYMNEQRVGSSATDGAVMMSLLSAAHILDDRIDKALSEVGLSMPKLGVLTHLVEAGEPLTLSALAERLSCVRSNITQLVDRLEADGLVRRVADPDDRRSIRAELTQVGKERQVAGAKQLAAVQTSFAKSLSASDRDSLVRVLASIG